MVMRCGCVRLRRPLVLQSKSLCVSLVFLLTTLPFSIYIAFRHRPAGSCITLPSILVLLHSESDGTAPHGLLFAYPPSYGEHKHALPTASATCAAPLHFADYNTVHRQVQQLCHNLTSQQQQQQQQQLLLYDHDIQNGEDDTDTDGKSSSSSSSSSFAAGNQLSKEQRRSFFFAHGSNGTQHGQVQQQPIVVPCGSFNKLPIPHSDRLAMDNCRNVVVVSAIFGDHDKIRQPKGLGSHTLASACFFMFIDDSTHTSLLHHGILHQQPAAAPGKTKKDHHYHHQQAAAHNFNMVGVWRVVRLSSSEMPYDNHAMNGVIFKHLPHRLFPNAIFSIWIDAKIQLTVDPLLLLHSLLIKEGADMAVSKHPLYKHTLEEAMATARWHKWGDVESIRMQMETYCANGLQPWTKTKLPFPSDVPDTALIIRKHLAPSNLFSCLLFNELEAFSPRDQLAFAYVRDRMNPRMRINMFDVQVFEHIAVEYRHNLKHSSDHGGSGGGSGTVISRMAASGVKLGQSNCSRYLATMWGEDL